MVKRNLSRKLELFCLSVDQGEGLWTKFFINRYRGDFYFFMQIDKGKRIKQP